MSRRPAKVILAIVLIDALTAAILVMVGSKMLL
jgi:hypothetical protein